MHLLSVEHLQSSKFGGFSLTASSFFKNYNNLIGKFFEKKANRAGNIHDISYIAYNNIYVIMRLPSWCWYSLKKHAMTQPECNNTYEVIQ